MYIRLWTCNLRKTWLSRGMEFSGNSNAKRFPRICARLEGGEQFIESLLTVDDSSIVEISSSIGILYYVVSDLRGTLMDRLNEIHS